MKQSVGGGLVFMPADRSVAVALRLHALEVEEHPGSIAVIDELYSGVDKRALQFAQRIHVAAKRAAGVLDPLHGGQMEPRPFGEVLRGPLQQSPGGTELNGNQHLQATIKLLHD